MNGFDDMVALNKLWEELVLDVVTLQFPHVEDITGVRILDKSRAGQPQFRIEIWTKFNDKDNEKAIAMLAYMDATYIPMVPAGP